MLPLAKELYFPVYLRRPLFILLTNLFAPLGLISALLIIWQIKHTPKAHQSFLMIFLLASLGFLIAYLWQGQLWFYHALPFITCDIIALSYCVITTIYSLMKIERINNIEWKKILCGLISFYLIFSLCLTSLQFTLHSIIVNRAKNIALNLLISSHQHNAKTIIVSLNFLQVAYSYNYNMPINIHFSNIGGLFPGLQKLYLDHQLVKYQEMKKEVFALLVSDFQKVHPTYIIIDKDGFGIFKQSDQIFQFLPFLLSDNEFKNFFQQYHYVSENANFILYEK